MTDRRIQAAYIIAPAITIAVGLLIAAGILLSVRVTELQNVRDSYEGTLEHWTVFQSETTSLLFLSDPRTGYTGWIRSLEQFRSQCGVCRDRDDLSGLFRDSGFDPLISEIVDAWETVSGDIQELERMISPDSPPVERLRLAAVARNVTVRGETFTRSIRQFKNRIDTELRHAQNRLNLIPLLLGLLLFASTAAVILTRRHAAIRERRQILALNAMMEGVIITDPAGRISFVNGHAAELYGWNPREVLGHPLEDEAPRLDALAPGAETMTHADADGRTIECSIREIYGGGSSSIGTIYVLRDMTDALARKALDDRARQLEGIGSLAGTIAHEFNNILGGMLGSISLLEANGDDERRAQRISSLRTGISRARKLSNRLMVFSEGHTPTRTRESLNDLLAREIRSFDFPIDVDCALFRCPQNVMVSVNPEQLGEVFRSILQNAVEAMEGDGTICVKTQADRSPDRDEPEWISIRVEDTGPGIADAVAARVFDPFFTTSENRRGIGLSIAYKVISAHDGDIAIHTRGDATGCCVEIHLPALRDDSR
ncbi:MAG: PAS domain-containing sensor histidine kinase [Spirochaetaceae bacterium]|nr:MAG: PAS domain-containing sensor histidine kinase [Spirochaetaceae bacterium]